MQLRRGGGELEDQNEFTLNVSDPQAEGAERGDKATHSEGDPSAHLPVRTRGGRGNRLGVSRLPQHISLATGRLSPRAWGQSLLQEGSRGAGGAVSTHRPQEASPGVGRPSSLLGQAPTKPLAETAGGQAGDWGPGSYLRAPARGSSTGAQAMPAKDSGKCRSRSHSSVSVLYTCTMPVTLLRRQL